VEASGQLTFHVRNRIGSPAAGTSKDPDSGIGLANVRKRLDLLYGDGYRLEINEHTGWYEVTLILNGS